MHQFRRQDRRRTTRGGASERARRGAAVDDDRGGGVLPRRRRRGGGVEGGVGRAPHAARQGTARRQGGAGDVPIARGGGAAASVCVCPRRSARVGIVGAAGAGARARARRGPKDRAARDAWCRDALRPGRDEPATTTSTTSTNSRTKSRPKRRKNTTTTRPRFGPSSPRRWPRSSPHEAARDDAFRLESTVETLARARRRAARSPRHRGRALSG